MTIWIKMKDFLNSECQDSLSVELTFELASDGKNQSYEEPQREAHEDTDRGNHGCKGSRERTNLAC